MLKTKIIGLGNTFCGDDAVGAFIAHHLLEYSSDHISIIEGGLAGLTLLHEMEHVDTLILIDAVCSESKTGTIFRFMIPEDLVTIEPLAWSSSASSTHSFGLAEALTLAHTLEALPQRVTLYGIELGDIHKGQTLSPEVSQAMKKLVQRISTEELSLAHA